MGDHPGERFDLVCPECGAKLRLKPSRFGLFYGCETWSQTRCSGSHGAHQDGAPFGVPANSETKLARGRAHAVFDLLWKSGAMTRGQAYAWLAEALGQPDPHIGAMTIEECERVVVLATKRTGELGCDTTRSGTNNSRGSRRTRSRPTRSRTKPRT